MGRSPCCEKEHTNKGAWTKEEDERLINYIKVHGEGCWRSLPKAAGKNLVVRVYNIFWGPIISLRFWLSWFYNMVSKSFLYIILFLLHVRPSERDRGVSESRTQVTRERMIYALIEIYFMRTCSI